MNVLKTLSIVVFAGAMGACATTKPVYNVENAPVASGKSLTAVQVRTGIVTAGAALGWQMVDVKPGLIEGTLNLRGHTAVVEIPYSVTTFSIIYKRGVNLAEQDGQIHKNYNGWIQNLEKGIKGALSSV